jgi:hypothetical protein
MENKYTQQEVLSNISKLNKIESDLILQRKELNRQLLEIRKQIEYWNELDLSQLKIF